MTDVTNVGTSVRSELLPVHKISLLTGGLDRPYCFGLTLALASKSVYVDVIGSDEVDSPAFHTIPNVTVLKLLTNRNHKERILARLFNIVIFYARLFKYAATAPPMVFHILWNNRFEHFDRTILMWYYKILRKKIVLTVHNVNAGKRDSNDSFLNRITLKMQYLAADHLFVHTEKMKSELIKDFRVPASAVTVIPFGINNAVPHTSLRRAEARKRLGLGSGEKTVLFFGSIRPYKGVEYLVSACQRLMAEEASYRLIIAGEPKKGSERYVKEIRERLDRGLDRDRVIEHMTLISDEDTEVYFKAADVLVLPYTHVFQSGVLVLAYSFGLPVVATDVGGFSQDIVVGKTGFLCRPRDTSDLAATIKKFFESELYRNDSGCCRQEIVDHANSRHSWEVVADRTLSVYSHL